MSTKVKPYKKLKDVLGHSLVNEQIESNYDFITQADKGVTATAINNFKSYFDITREETAAILNVSSPTLYRWISSNKNLSRNTSIQLLELTDLFLLGSEIFNSKEDFIKWLKLPNQSIGGMEPMHLLEFPGGFSKVRDLLGRIEHGVFS